MAQNIYIMSGFIVVYLVILMYLLLTFKTYRISEWGISCRFFLKITLYDWAGTCFLMFQDSMPTLAVCTWNVHIPIQFYLFSSGYWWRKRRKEISQILIQRNQVLYKWFLPVLYKWFLFDHVLRNCRFLIKFAVTKNTMMNRFLNNLLNKMQTCMWYWCITKLCK